jgi:hypothetical protein
LVAARALTKTQTRGISSNAGALPLATLYHADMQAATTQDRSRTLVTMDVPARMSELTTCTTAARDGCVKSLSHHPCQLAAQT